MTNNLVKKYHKIPFLLALLLILSTFVIADQVILPVIRSIQTGASTTIYSVGLTKHTGLEKALFPNPTATLYGNNI